MRLASASRSSSFLWLLWMKIEKQNYFREVKKWDCLLIPNRWPHRYECISGVLPQSGRPWFLYPNQWRFASRMRSTSSRRRRSPNPASTGTHDDYECRRGACSSCLRHSGVRNTVALQGVDQSLKGVEFSIMRHEWDVLEIFIVPCELERDGAVQRCLPNDARAAGLDEVHPLLAVSGENDLSWLPGDVLLGNSIAASVINCPSEVVAFFLRDVVHPFVRLDHVGAGNREHV